MQTKKKNQSDNLPGDKISKEIQSLLTDQVNLEKQVESEKKLYEVHFNKQWALEKELDKVKDTVKEKSLTKQITLEKKEQKRHKVKQFSLEKKQVSLRKKLLQKQLSLQKITVKKAAETAAATKKKSDIDNHIKLTKELNRMESRWEAFTEIS